MSAPLEGADVFADLVPADDQTMSAKQPQESMEAERADEVQRIREAIQNQISDREAVFSPRKKSHIRY